MCLKNYQVRQLDWQMITDIYAHRMQTDFPKNEIKPLEMIKNLYENGNNATFALYDASGNMIAYAMFEKKREDNVWLLDYFAVDDSCRGKGIGSGFLSLLREYICGADAVLIEIESVLSAKSYCERVIREKRKQFYLKNGVYETGVFSTAEGVEYEILCFPLRKALVADSARQAMNRIYSMFFSMDKFTVC